MNEEDKKAFLDDFKAADIDKKLDMWYFALDQEAIWEEIMEEMSTIATKKQMEEAQARMKKKSSGVTPTCTKEE